MQSYKFPVSYDEVCPGCANTACRKGCYAARISRGEKLTDADIAVCPLKSDCAGE